MYYLRQPDTTGGNRTCTQVLLPYRIHAYVHIFNVRTCMCVYKACIICARLVLRILGKNGIELGKTGSLLGNWCHGGQEMCLEEYKITHHCV